MQRENFQNFRIFRRYVVDVCGRNVKNRGKFCSIFDCETWNRRVWISKFFYTFHTLEFYLRIYFSNVLLSALIYELTSFKGCVFCIFSQKTSDNYDYFLSKWLFQLDSLTPERAVRAMNMKLRVSMKPAVGMLTRVKRAFILGRTQLVALLLFFKWEMKCFSLDTLVVCYAWPAAAIYWLTAIWVL